jgi:hypothetical protein
MIPGELIRNYFSLSELTILSPETSFILLFAQMTSCSAVQPV